MVRIGHGACIYGKSGGQEFARVPEISAKHNINNDIELYMLVTTV
jgi:hypothetical protein